MTRAGDQRSVLSGATGQRNAHPSYVSAPPDRERPTRGTPALDSLPTRPELPTGRPRPALTTEAWVPPEENDDRPLADVLTAFRAARSGVQAAPAEEKVVERFTSAMRALRRAVTRHPIDEKILIALAELRDSEPPPSRG